MFVAACANCENWNGACALQLAPPAGEPRCDRYQISDAFAAQLASRVLQDVTIVAPVPLRPLSNTQRKKRARAAGGKPRRGFRS